MEFGYFTLSDNHYLDNTRAPNQFIADITSEALYAEELGMHSAWIGEHHFSTLGVLKCPDLVLSYIAARTRHIRLAPAVTALPLHHPIRVAEQWATLDLLSGGRVDFAAGRGYDRREYLPFYVSFENNQSIFNEGMEVVRNLWSSDGRLPHHGASTIHSTTSGSRRDRSSSRFQPTSPLFRNRRSSLPPGSAAG
jgi:alkanesulfonate monooxygenase SsuD/methylene tetrahydromethanopterin reductase-like flavin-dependent oxidoreductase (luciferase family)